MAVDRPCHSDPCALTVWDIGLTVWTVMRQAGHTEMQGISLSQAGLVSFDEEFNEGMAIL